MNTLGYPVGLPVKDPIIRFYALFILTGALIALLLSNYRAHKEGFKGMSFFSTIFPIAFLCGIIGARIWYVVATYQDEFAGRGFLAMIDIRSGGLAIQGGAIGGILGGVIYALFRRKGTSILKMMDWAIPTILIAQAIGRFGNFFNQEVFGHFIPAENWNFLPSFITNNMQNGSMAMGQYVINGEIINAANTGIRVPEGAIAAPLFLVEGICNCMFYFIMTAGIPALFGKRLKDGDQAFFYFISYGIIRLVLEPLRNPSFIMGDNTGTVIAKSEYKSMMMAIAFIAIGVLLIVINHLLHYLASKGKFDRVPKFKAIFDPSIYQSTVTLKREDVKIEEKEDLSYLKLKEKEKELQGKEEKDE